MTRMPLAQQALLPLLFLSLGVSLLIGCGEVRLGREACWACDGSLGIAPTPSEAHDAQVQLYGARAYKWHGIFAVHTWIAYKPKNAGHYTAVHLVRRWGFPGEAAFRIFRDPHPDRRWHGAAPELLYALSGEEAEAAIPQIQKVVDQYPRTYHVWPGPNSNTFTANVVREVPELSTELPPTAIGKDFLLDWRILAKSPSGTGFQVSLLGLLGFMVGLEEGVELNVLGLSFGVDLNPPALKLPVIGRVGFPQGNGQASRVDFRQEATETASRDPEKTPPTSP